MHKPILSIVVPARNSSSTLRHTLAHLNEICGNDCEITVVDNASDDDSATMLSQFKDLPNFNVHCFSESVSMSENWERGLSLSSGAYLTYIGADDGLWGSGLKSLTRLLRRNDRFDAVSWGKVGYRWPSFFGTGALKSALRMRPQIVTREATVKSQDVVASTLTDLGTAYLRLPSLYNSAVKREVIENIKSRNDLLFDAQTPDIYSGFRISAEITEFLSLPFPVTISGVSALSNGVATFSGKKTSIGSNFSKMNVAAGNGLEPFLPDVQCYATCIIDSYVKFIKRASHPAASPYLHRKIKFEDAVEAIGSQVIRHFQPNDAQMFFRYLEDVYQNLVDKLNADPIAYKLFDVSNANSFAYEAEKTPTRESLKTRIGNFIFNDDRTSDMPTIVEANEFLELRLRNLSRALPLIERCLCESRDTALKKLVYRLYYLFLVACLMSTKTPHR